VKNLWLITGEGNVSTVLLAYGATAGALISCREGALLSSLLLSLSLPVSGR